MSDHDTGEDVDNVCDAWEPPATVKRLVEYADSYLAAFNALRAELSAQGPPLALYGEELAAAAIILGEDGIAVFYVTEEQRARRNGPKGVDLKELSYQTLSTITQVATANNLKVDARQPGGSDAGEPTAPNDLPESELNAALTSVLVAPTGPRGPGRQTQTIIALPRWKSEQGRLAQRLPARGRVLSPFVAMPPDGRPALQFSFPFADLIWGHEQLGLNADAGPRLARADLDVLLRGVPVGKPSPIVYTGANS